MSKQQQQLLDPKLPQTPDLVSPIEGGWEVGVQFSMSTNKVEGEPPLWFDLGFFFFFQ